MTRKVSASRKLFFWVALATSTFGSAIRADRFYVDVARGGEDASQLETVRELIRTSVIELKVHELEADKTKADYTLAPFLLRLGNAYILKLEKIKADRVIFSGQLKAAQIEELDKVALRLTRSVINNVNASDDPHVGEVTENEATDGMQRKPTRKEWFLGFGAVTFGQLDASGLGVSLEVARAWDLNRAAIRLFGNFGIKGDAYLGSGGLGVNYFITTGDVAPFVGADFGYGFSKSGGDGVLGGETTSGFVVGTTAGVVVFRSSSVNLELSARAAFLLANSSIGHPNEIAFRIGIYY